MKILLTSLRLSQCWKKSIASTVSYYFMVETLNAIHYAQNAHIHSANIIRQRHKYKDGCSGFAPREFLFVLSPWLQLFSFHILAVVYLLCFGNDSLSLGNPLAAITITYSFNNVFCRCDILNNLVARIWYHDSFLWWFLPDSSELISDLQNLSRKYPLIGQKNKTTQLVWFDS